MRGTLRSLPLLALMVLFVLGSLSLLSVLLLVSMPVRCADAARRFRDGPRLWQLDQFSNAFRLGDQ